MNGRRGLGPVFVYDMRTMVRRWQMYATRGGFIFFLLMGMMVAWLFGYDTVGSAVSYVSIHQMAAIGEGFFYALAIVQLTFLLMAAPAATAGSICIDRSRGTLLHMMVTDLSDVEIVLGRLGSRLAPVFGLIASAIPVMAVASLLGGIDFEAVVYLFIVSGALTVLGCSLAMAISVKASKTHEVLMAVYLALGLWLLAPVVWYFIESSSNVPPVPDSLWKLNPYMLVLARYLDPGFVSWLDMLLFTGGTLGLSAGLVGWTVWRLRRTVIGMSGENAKARRPPGWLARHWPRLPGPTLDANPVLWREWHRNRPSRLALWLWRGMYFCTWALVLWGIWAIMDEGVSGFVEGLDLALVLQLFFGFLMIAATTPTALAEERTRGSLDVLLSTPLSTRSIVLAKWWGAFRPALGLAILPVFITLFLALATPDVPTYVWSIKKAAQVIPLTLTDRLVAPVLCLLDFFASAALIVSIGILVATWIPRVGRAVGTSVVIYIVFGVGWITLLEMIDIPGLGEAATTGLGALNLAFGPVFHCGIISGMSVEPRRLEWIFLGLATLVKLGGAAALLGLTLLTFNRCMGRVVESRPEGYKPRLEPLIKQPKLRKPGRKAGSTLETLAGLTQP